MLARPPSTCCPLKNWCHLAASKKRFMTSYGNSIGGRGLRRCACNGQIKSARALSVFEWGNEHTEVQVQSNLPPGVPDWNSFSAVAWGGEVHMWLCVCFVYDRRLTSGWKTARWRHWSGLWDSFNTISYNHPRWKIIARPGILFGFYFYCGSLLDPSTVESYFIIIIIYILLQC